MWGGGGSYRAILCVCGGGGGGGSYRAILCVGGGGGVHIGPFCVCVGGGGLVVKLGLSL